MGPGFSRGGLPSARGPYEAPAIPTTKDVLNTLTLLKRMYRRLPDALMAQWVSGPRGLVANYGFIVRWEGRAYQISHSASSPFLGDPSRCSPEPLKGC